MLPTQFELLDTLYVVLRQMPRFRRAAYSYAPAHPTAASNAVGVHKAGGGGPTGREFDNMAEFLSYRCVCVCVGVYINLCVCMHVCVCMCICMCICV